MNAGINPDTFRVLYKIQEEIHTNNRIRTHVHYKEGYGALIVQEGAPLNPQYVLLAVSEPELQMRSHFY